MPMRCTVILIFANITLKCPVFAMSRLYYLFIIVIYYYHLLCI